MWPNGRRRLPTAFAVGLLFPVVNPGRQCFARGRLAVQASPLHVIDPQHIHNALRKMASGGPCTLRFFTEGDRLCTTGIAVVPGSSGDRLSNVIRMLSDTDYADRVSGSTFRASEAGQALLAQRRVAT
jgi:hypothetical protein